MFSFSFSLRIMERLSFLKFAVKKYSPDNNKFPEKLIFTFIQNDQAT